MMQMAVLAFNAFSLTTKLIMIGSLLASIGIAGGVVYAKVYNKGYDAAIAAVAADNKKAIGRATALRSKRRDAGCAARGMRWSTVAGECE